MSDRSVDESDGGWSGDGSDTAREATESKTGWSEDGSETETEQQRLPGRHILATLRWAVSVLRASPLLVVVALVASSVELFIFQSEMELFVAFSGLPRWGISFFGIVAVGAVAGVVAVDVLEDRHRTVVARLGAFLESLPAALFTAIIFAFPILFGVSFLISDGYLPYKLVIAVLGGYLLAEFLVVVPAVVLDRSMRQGRTAFAESRLAALGLLLVLTLGHAPIVRLSPTLAEPVLAIGLALWAGVVTATLALAYTRIYLAHRPTKSLQAGSDGSQARGPQNGRHGMWNRPGGGPGGG